MGALRAQLRLLRCGHAGGRLGRWLAAHGETSGSGPCRCHTGRNTVAQLPRGGARPACPPRKFKSVVDQLRILSEFLDKRPTASGADPTVSSVLRRLADVLDGKEPNCADSKRGKPDKARPEDAQDAARRRRRPGPILTRRRNGGANPGGITSPKKSLDEELGTAGWHR